MDHANKPIASELGQGRVCVAENLGRLAVDEHGPLPNEIEDVEQTGNQRRELSDQPVALGQFPLHLPSAFGFERAS
jgi:hypothetical protein